MAAAAIKLTSEQVVDMARACRAALGADTRMTLQAWNSRDGQVVTWINNRRLAIQPSGTKLADNGRVFSTVIFLDIANRELATNGNFPEFLREEDAPYALQFVPDRMLAQYTVDRPVLTAERERRRARADINSSDLASFMHRNGMRHQVRAVDEMLHGPGRLVPLPARSVQAQRLAVSHHWVDARYTPVAPRKREEDDDADDDKPRKRLP